MGKKKIKIKVLGAVAVKHKRVLKNLGKHGSVRKAMEAAGYSKSYAKNGDIKNTKTFQQEAEKELPSKLLLKVHKEGLEATTKLHKIVDRDDDGKPVYDFVDVDDFGVRHRYLDTAYKLKNYYSDGTTINNTTIDLSNYTKEELAKIVSG